MPSARTWLRAIGNVKATAQTSHDITIFTIKATQYVSGSGTTAKLTEFDIIVRHNVAKKNLYERTTQEWCLNEQRIINCRREYLFPVIGTVHEKSFWNDVFINCVTKNSQRNIKLYRYVLYNTTKCFTYCYLIVYLITISLNYFIQSRRHATNQINICALVDLFPITPRKTSTVTVCFSLTCFSTRVFKICHNFVPILSSVFRSKRQTPNGILCVYQWEEECSLGQYNDIANYEVH